MGPFQGMVATVCLPDFRTKEFIREVRCQEREHLGWSGRLRPAIAIEKKLCGKDKWKENLKCPFIQSIKKSGVSK